MLLFLLSSLSAWGMAMLLPKIILKVEQNVISQCDDIKKSSAMTTPMYPFVAIVLFNIAPVFYFFQPYPVFLPVFLFLLSVSSYIDIVRRWVPDSVLFLLIGYSIYFIASGKIGDSPEEQLIATSMFVFPLIALNGFSWLKKKVWMFASGDIYIAFSIGLWLEQKYAFGVAGGSILLALVYGAIFRQPRLPFIPFMFFSFLISCLI